MRQGKEDGPPPLPLWVKLCSIYTHVHVHQCFWWAHMAHYSLLAQRTSHLAQLSSLFGPDGTVNYDYIATNSINSLLIGSKCIRNGTLTNHCWANLAHASKVIKNSDVHVHVHNNTRDGKKEERKKERKKEIKTETCTCTFGHFVQEVVNEV